MERLKDIFDMYYDLNPFVGNLVFLDTETTGLKTTDRLNEIGCIGIQFNGIECSFSIFSSLMNPGLPSHPEALAVSGISQAEIDAAEKEEIVLEQFCKWLDKLAPSKIIAHNAQFDEGKIRYNLSRLGLGFNYGQFECTMRMAINKKLPTKNNKLNTLSEHFGFVNTQKHRALTDAETCAYIWAKMQLG